MNQHHVILNPTITHKKHIVIRRGKDEDYLFDGESVESGDDGGDEKQEDRDPENGAPPHRRHQSTPPRLALLLVLPFDGGPLLASSYSSPQSPNVCQIYKLYLTILFHQINCLFHRIKLKKREKEIL